MENLDGINSSEDLIEEIYEIINTPKVLDFIEGDFSGIRHLYNINCLNCGYVGEPVFDHIEYENKPPKKISVCPICGDKSWATLVSLILEIRNAIENYYI